MVAVITLTTDLGWRDSYVAAMKGVILGINPEARLVDITHSIEPQNIRQAAFVLASAYSYFPRGTVHLAVVDPGVGTSRRVVVLRTGAADFVAPDNGVLSYVLEPFLVRTEEHVSPHPVRFRAEMEGYIITRAKYWRTPVSDTFHGRDILAPVAAHLSMGVTPVELGEKIDSAIMLPLPRPRQEADGSLTGHIIHVDAFGNLVTDIRKSDIPQTIPITVEVSSELISGLSRTYAEAREILVLLGSSGYLEVARKNGSAAEYLKAGVGDKVRVRFMSDE